MTESSSVSCFLWHRDTKESVMVYIVSERKAFIVLLLNLTTPKNAVSVAVQHCGCNGHNAALTINNGSSETTFILLCLCIFTLPKWKTFDGLITVSGPFLEVTSISSSDLAGRQFPVRQRCSSRFNFLT